jgi:hypothetical protein
MILPYVLNLIEELNGLLILNRGEGLSEEEETTLKEESTVEEIEWMVASIKRDEVIDLIIATDDK